MHINARAPVLFYNIISHVEHVTSLKKLRSVFKARRDTRERFVRIRGVQDNIYVRKIDSLAQLEKVGICVCLYQSKNAVRGSSAPGVYDG